ncbi:MAG: transcription antitermination factor NusB [Bacteroidota bacterium]
MISRRTIRIKVLQTLYTYYSTPDKSINNSEKELFFSLGKTYDLYHMVFQLIIDIADYAQLRIDTNLNKLRPTQEDLNPNTRFVENRIIQQLRINRRLKAYVNQTGISWANHPELVKDLYHFTVESEFYNEYMTRKQCSYFDDKKLVEKIMNNIILISEDLHQVLEEDSIYWNDDLDLVVAMATKTIRFFNEQSDENQPLLPKFKDEDDRQFAVDLFRKSILNNDELRNIVDQHASNWDLERIAFMDVLIMQLALAEILYFPSIPTKVTLNEYIEMAKYYSTEKSRTFINGILDKSLKDLKQSQKVLKTGRGLIGEEE